MRHVLVAGRLVMLADPGMAPSAPADAAASPRPGVPCPMTPDVARAGASNGDAAELPVAAEGSGAR